MKPTLITYKFYNAQGKLIRGELFSVQELITVAKAAQSQGASRIFIHKKQPNQGKEILLQPFLIHQNTIVQSTVPVLKCDKCGFVSRTVSIRHAILCDGTQQ